MKNLFQEPSIIVTLSPTSFQQARCISLLKRWRVPRQVQFASDPQVVQIISYGISIQRYHPLSPASRIEPSSLGKMPTSLMITNQECYKKIKEDLILRAHNQTDVQNVVTPNTEKGLGVQQASTNVRFVTNLATSVACATGREMACIMSKGPWVHPGHTN